MQVTATKFLLMKTRKNFSFDGEAVPCLPSVSALAGAFLVCARPRHRSDGRAAAPVCRSLCPLQSNMPPKKKEKKPVWRGSNAQRLLEKDVVDGVVTDKDDPWDVFLSRPEFAPFDEYFPKYVKSLLQKVARERKHADVASAALSNDRRIDPPTDDPRGYPVFQGSEAERQLKEDMDNGLHEQYKPQELYNHPDRAEYRRWPLDVFRNHIHQELRIRIEGKYWKEYKKEKQDQRKW